MEESFDNIHMKFCIFQVLVSAYLVFISVSVHNHVTLHIASVYILCVQSLDPPRYFKMAAV